MVHLWITLLVIVVFRSMAQSEDRGCSETTCFTLLSSEEGYTFEESIDVCSEIGKTLAMVPSARDNKTVRRLLEGNSQDYSGSVWIGLRRVEISSEESSSSLEFEFVSNNKLLDFAIENRQPWGPTEPSVNGNCVSIDEDLLWRVSNCSSLFGSLLCSSKNRGQVRNNNPVTGDTERQFILASDEIKILFILAGVAGVAMILAFVGFLSTDYFPPSGRDERLISRTKLPVVRINDLTNKPLSTAKLPTLHIEQLGSVRQSRRKSLTESERRRGYETIANQFSSCYSANGIVLGELIEELCEGGNDKAIQIVRKVMPFIDKQTERNFSRRRMSNGEFSKFLVDEEDVLPLRHYLVQLVSELIVYYSNNKGEEIGPASLVYALIYISRLEQSSNFGVALNKFNSHRLFAVFILIAAKYAEDEELTTDYWATVCDMSVYELLELEDLICFHLKFDFTVDEKEMTSFIQMLKLHYRNSK